MAEDHQTASSNFQKGLKSIWAATKNAAQKATNEAAKAWLKTLQNQTRSAMADAENFRHLEAVAEALANIPDDWESLDLNQMRTLSSGAVKALRHATRDAAEAKAKAEREALEQANRDRRFGEVIALMNDDAEIARFCPGDVLVKEDRKNFERVVKGRNAGDGNIASNTSSAYIAAAAKTYPDDLVFGCAVGQFPEPDRQIIRVAAILMRHKALSVQELNQALAGMIFRHSGERIYSSERKRSNAPIISNITTHGDNELKDALLEGLRLYLPMPEDTRQDIVNLATRLQREYPHAPVSQELVAHGGGGATWFTSSDIATSIYGGDSESNGLFLGTLEDGTSLRYDGEGSLFTIAPPGSGKTQCQVMPNLIAYDGSAIILDVKGECYEQTAGFRSQVYGKVLRFDPTDWEHSAHFNPLDFVRSDERFLAADARKLADMLIVAQKTNDPYWESRGRDVLAALIGFVAVVCDDKERTMKSVMDLLSPSPTMLEELIEQLRQTGIPFLERTANQIESMSEKQLSSILDSARSQLSVWDLGELDPITDRSDWHPRDFKQGDEPLTLYLCIGPADIQRFASVLRVILGQHLDYFMEVLPDNVERPIVFFLDEAPQLGNFEPLPKASALGRQYGIRLWLFAQNRNQIETAYASADTVLGNAVVQCWMNPDEMAANHLEQNLGRTRGLFDGMEKPLIEAHELRGPDYKDQIIVIGRGEKPANLTKHFAFNDPDLKKTMGLPVEITDQS